MNWTNLSLAVLLISFSIFSPSEIVNKSIAQEAGESVTSEENMNSEESTTSEENMNSEENVTLEELVNNPKDLLGKTVSVRGETENVESGSVFVLSSEEGIKSIFGEDEVLVININNQPSVLPKDNADIQVTGQVAEFVLENVNQEYGLNLDPEVYGEYESKPVILADSIALAPEPGEITKNPQTYYDKLVAVEGEVKNIVSTSVFTLDEKQLIGGSDLVIVNLSGEPLPDLEEVVVITGVVRPVVKADLEKYYNLKWDTGVQEKIAIETSSIPVLIADSITTAAQE